jgi:hypothetical protein
LRPTTEIIREYSCSPQYPCRRSLTCQYCARVRQAKYADIAERIEAAFGGLEFAVLTPGENTARAIERVKNAALRAALSPAMIWSVEIGEQAQRLHLNIVGHQLNFRKIRNCSIHVQPVHTSARIATAYMLKSKSRPNAHIYEGRTVGTAGSLMQWLTQARHMPVPQGAAMLQVLNTARIHLSGKATPTAEMYKRLQHITRQFTEALERAETIAAQKGTG